MSDSLSTSLRARRSRGGDGGWAQQILGMLA
jgi:hypothetical protein